MDKIQQNARDALEAELQADLVDVAAKALWDSVEHALLASHGYPTQWHEQPESTKVSVRHKAKAVVAAVNEHQNPGYTLVSTKTLEWLLGERGLFEPTPEQVDMHTKLVGKVTPYWWRTQLRQAMLK